MSLQQELGTPWHYEKVGALDLVTPRAIGMSGSQALRAGDGPHQSAFAVGTDPNCSARIPPLQPLFCRHAGAACKNGSRFQKGTMARRPRIVLENVAHHVVARGVGQMQIFRSGFDKRKYLKRFTLIADEEHVSVHAYCLMDNHVHWIVTPSDPNGLARLYRRLHTWWAMKLNRWMGRCGHVFQNRFHSSPLDENHYWTALRYVEVNPRRAGLGEQLEDWDCSSAKAHLTGTIDPLVPLAEETGRRRFTAAQWREFLERTDTEAEKELRLALPGSRPCGNAEWVQSLEKTLKRKLTWKPRLRLAPLQTSPASA